MRHVDRSAVPVPGFFRSKRRKTLTAGLHEQLAASGTRKRQTRAKIGFSELRNDSGIRAALLELFHGNCAYCETPLRDSYALDHFRPTVLFPELAYEWSNLYPVCSRCNRHKGANFPVLHRNGAVEPWSGEADRDLPPALLDPCADDPNRFLAFDPEGTVGIPTGRGGRKDAARSEWTIEVLALNRNELVSARRKAGFDAEAAFQRAASEGWQLLREELERPAGFYAFRQQVLNRMSRRRPGARAFLKEAGLAIEARGTSRKAAIDRGRSIIANATIRKLSIRNFKGIGHFATSLPEEAAVDWLEGVGAKSLETGGASESPVAASPWLTLLGENGSGKSSVLQAIALALAGPAVEGDALFSSSDWFSWSDLIRHGRKSARVRVWLSDGSDPIDLRITKTGPTYAGWIENAAFVRAYGATRLPPRGKSRVQPRLVEFENLFDPFRPLIDADTWLGGLGRDERDTALLAVRDLLDLADEHTLEFENGKITVDGQALDLLSTGYQTIVALACDIMAGVPGGVADMQTAQGIILIDEVGAHLHPAWKMRIVPRLRRAFRSLQFLTSTHEPLCLRGHGDGEVVRVERSWIPRRLPSGAQSGRWEVEFSKPGISPHALRVDQLLTSSFFGLGSTVDPEVDARFQRYYQLLEKRRRLSKKNRAELDTLRAALAHEGVLGLLRRDQLVYEAIDAYLADGNASHRNFWRKQSARVEADAAEADAAETAHRAEQDRRRQEIKQRVAQMWRVADFAPEETEG